MDYQNTILFIAGFGLVALAAKEIGYSFTKIKLPLISGFLVTGLVAGPYILGLLTQEATESLLFLEEAALAFIAFAAGSELYWQEIKDRMRSILWITVGLVVFTLSLGSVSLYWLSDFIPFMQGLTPAGQVGIALLGGSILVARSPSAAIAVINELRAKGTFTQTVLGVTVIMDVIVITLFAINLSIADALLTNVGFNLSFVILLIVELFVSLLLGYILSKVLHLVLMIHLNTWLKSGIILVIGYSVFILSHQIRHLSHEYLAIEFLLEPLLICMIGSFIVTNYTGYRTDFLKILRDTGLPVYIAFFTLTGASLRLDILLGAWSIALVLFVIRLIAISLGSFVGGVIAGEPMKHNQIRWMAFVTQAGVGLGLAQEVAVMFPEWGTSFATIIIAVIVLNETIGPLFFKWAITLAGEARSRAEGLGSDGERNALIFGLEGQSLALARQLTNSGWKPKIITQQSNYLKEELDHEDIEIHTFSQINLGMLHQVNAGKADVLVTLLSDEQNYKICELAYENFGLETMVVRLNKRENFDRFHQLGVLIVDPATAIVSLLDQFVRSPVAASLLLGLEKNQRILDIEVCNPNLHGLALRDLRLPLDTLILSIRREGRTLISHGYTRLKLGDWVTVVGSGESLEQVHLRFEY